MATVRLRWEETVAYEADFEIEDLDPEQYAVGSLHGGDDDSPIMEGILRMEDEELGEAFEGVLERSVEVLSVTETVRS